MFAYLWPIPRSLERAYSTKMWKWGPFLLTRHPKMDFSLTQNGPKMVQNGQIFYFSFILLIVLCACYKTCPSKSGLLPKSSSYNIICPGKTNRTGPLKIYNKTRLSVSRWFLMQENMEWRLNYDILKVKVFFNFGSILLKESANSSYIYIIYTLCGRLDLLWKTFCY